MDSVIFVSHIYGLVVDRFDGFQQNDSQWLAMPSTLLGTLKKNKSDYVYTGFSGQRHITQTVGHSDYRWRLRSVTSANSGASDPQQGQLNAIHIP